LIDLLVVGGSAPGVPPSSPLHLRALLPAAIGQVRAEPADLPTPGERPLPTFPRDEIARLFETP
jgi:hypothetical protein